MSKLSAIIPFVLATSSIFAQNLLPSSCSTFETEELPTEIIRAWNASAVQLTDKESYRGSKSLELTYGKATKLFGAYFPATGGPFKAGDTYTCSLYIKAEKACNPQIWALALPTDSYDKYEWSKYSLRNIQPGSWQQMQATVTMEKDTPRLCCYIAVYGGYEGKVWVDDVKIERGDKATGEIPRRITPEKSLFPQETFPIVKIAPVDMDDTAWENIPGRKLEYSKDSGLSSTILKYTSDNDHLYFLFDAECPEISSHLCKSKAGKGPDWEDERVELHIRPGTGTSIRNFYFTVNADGAWYSSCREFNGDMAQARRSENGVKAFFKIPKRLFGASGTLGQAWSINANRFHRAGVKGASALFPYTKVFTDGMVPMLFVDSDKAPEIALVEYGALREYAGEIGGNVMTFEFRENVPENLSLVVCGSQPIAPRIKGRKAEFLYNVVDGQKVDYALFRGKGKVLDGKLTPGAFLTSGLDYVTPVADPVYESILGEARSGQRLMLLWMLLLTKKDMACALKSAVPYSYDAIYKEVYDAGMSMQCNDVIHALPKLQLKKMYTKGLYIQNNDPTADQLCQMLEARTARPFTCRSNTIITGKDANGHIGLSQHKNGLRGFMIDPVNGDAYVEFAERYVDVYGKCMGAFFPADELIGFDDSLYKNGFHEKHNLENPNGTVQKIEAEIKEKYGKGKYGSSYGMDSSSPDFPWCRLATLKTVNEHLTQLMERTRKAVKDRQPDLPFISDDAYQPAAHMVCNWGRYADAGSFQVGEGDKDFGENFPWQMYRTKLVKDLSRMKEMLVVPHAPIDGLPLGALSEAGRRESYSQLLRGGATGMNIYPHCICGPSQQPLQPDSIKIGFPESWHHLVEFAKIWQKMPELQFPDAYETGVLFSEASEIIIGGNSKRPECAFNLLGVRPQGWMSFISETLVERKQIALTDYRRLFIPYAPVSSKETIDACSAYVEQGGLLVICDPEFALKDNWNESLATERKALVGVELASAKTGKITFNGRTFPAPANSWSIGELPTGAKVLAAYDDNTPAAFELAKGKGRMIFFAFPVMVNDLAKDENFTEAFLAWEKQEKLQANEAIWHFTIPEVPAMPSTSAGDGICLTGNMAIWKRGTFFEARNNNVSLPYAVTVDGTPETALTDRLENFAKQTSFRDYNPEPWIHRFSPGKHTISVSFETSQLADSLTLYVTGTVPELTISADGNALGVVPTFEAGANNLIRYDISFPKQNLKELQVSFEQAEGTEFCIAELEVWRNRRKCPDSMEIHNAQLK